MRYGALLCPQRLARRSPPNISGYLRRLYLVPGIAATVNIDHIKRHYYMSHAHINPTRIVPLGPRLKFCAPVE